MCVGRVTCDVPIKQTDSLPWRRYEIGLILPVPVIKSSTTSWSTTIYLILLLWITPISSIMSLTYLFPVYDWMRRMTLLLNGCNLTNNKTSIAKLMCKLTDMTELHVIPFHVVNTSTHSDEAKVHSKKIRAAAVKTFIDKTPAMKVLEHKIAVNLEGGNTLEARFSSVTSIRHSGSCRQTWYRQTPDPEMLLS
jgi:hypothetical protein